MHHLPHALWTEPLSNDIDYARLAPYSITIITLSPITKCPITQAPQPPNAIHYINPISLISNKSVFNIQPTHLALSPP
jgi:hypothetical protein